MKRLIDFLILGTGKNTVPASPEVKNYLLSLQIPTEVLSTVRFNAKMSGEKVLEIGD